MSAATITYTVQNNDTIRSLAVKFKTTAANIAQINHITSNAYIFPGMQLTVPVTNLDDSEKLQNLASKSINKSENCRDSNDSRRNSGSLPQTTSLTDILNLNFLSQSNPISSLVTRRNSSINSITEEPDNQQLPRNQSLGTESLLQEQKNLPRSKNISESANTQLHTNQELISENAGFIKLESVLLPDDVNGTIIVTSSALMFDPKNEKLHDDKGMILRMEDLSWLEVVSVPKETTTTKKLEEEFPMVNSLFLGVFLWIEAETNNLSYSQNLKLNSLLITLSLQLHPRTHRRNQNLPPPNSLNDRIHKPRKTNLLPIFSTLSI